MEVGVEMGVLLIAVTSVIALAAVVFFVTARATDRPWLHDFVLGGITIWFVGYFAMLFGFSFSSEEKELGLNEPKKFCGFYLDCHMHAQVTDVRRSKTIGNKTADGEFYIVTVKVSSNAKKATLRLHGVDAHVVDVGGRTYSRDTHAETLLPSQPDFEESISPVESFDKQIVFDLPNDIESPRLDLRQGRAIDAFIEAFLIGDEDSIFHSRAYFRLDDGSRAAAVK